MSVDRIRYREGYKYQLAEDYSVLVPFYRASPAETEWLRLSALGWLLIRGGYCWDGPSGPTIDTASAMRGSLLHDSLYQLIRLGHLGADCRAVADQVYEDACLEDGMLAVRAWAHFKALRLFGGSSAEPSAEKPMLTAP